MKRDPKLWAALAYTLGLISGIVVLLVTRDEHDDQYVRFHAMQSVLTFAAIALLYILLPTIPIVGNIAPVRGLFTMAVFCLWVLLIVKAVTGDAYRLPYIGDLAHTMSSK
jgi:uncharacterized membrane protein